MNIKRREIIILILTILVGGWIFIFQNNIDYQKSPCDFELKEKTLYLGDESSKSIKVEIANTNVSRECGLSYRPFLNPGEGMLFEFAKPDFYGIWMREMLFPIDILWLDENFMVVDVKKDARPDTYPEIFKPNKESLYVLEVNSGFVDEKKILIGDFFKF